MRPRQPVQGFGANRTLRKILRDALIFRNRLRVLLLIEQGFRQPVMDLIQIGNGRIVAQQRRQRGNRARVVFQMNRAKPGAETAVLREPERVIPPRRVRRR